MSQHDFILDNQSGASFRSDLNAALLSIITNSSGSSAPPITYPYQFWADTTSGILKQRDSGNTTWLPVLTLSTGAPVSLASGTILGAISGGTFGPTCNRNKIINGAFAINQRVYVSNAVLSAGSYGHDRWKAGASGGDYTFTQNPNSTMITVKSGKTLIQVIEDVNVSETTYVLSWTGTAQARYAVNSATPAGSYAASPILISGQTVGTTMSVEFNTGTLGKVQLEPGSVVTPFEQRLRPTELAMCLRYYEHSYSDGVAVGTASSLGCLRTLSIAAGANSTVIPIQFKAPKRAIPTVTAYSPFNGASGYMYDSPTANRSVTYADVGTTGATFAVAVSTTSGTAHTVHYTASAEL